MRNRCLLALLAILLWSGCSPSSEPIQSPEPSPAEVVSSPSPEPTVAETPTPNPPAPAPPNPAELRKVIQDRYDDFSFATTTRDVNAQLEILDAPFIKEGKEEDQATQKADLEESVEWMNQMERDAGTTLRFSFRQEILEFTVESPERVLAKVHSTWRARSTDGGYVLEQETENTDAWVLKEDGKWRMKEAFPEVDLGGRLTSYGEVIEVFEPEKE